MVFLIVPGKETLQFINTECNRVFYLLFFANHLNKVLKREVVLPCTNIRL